MACICAGFIWPAPGALPWPAGIPGFPGVMPAPGTAVVCAGTDVVVPWVLLDPQPIRLAATIKQKEPCHTLKRLQIIVNTLNRTAGRRERADSLADQNKWQNQRAKVP